MATYVSFVKWTDQGIRTVTSRAFTREEITKIIGGLP